MALIFFDIDGTLATGTQVPESAAMAVAQARRAGHKVFICTGRPRRYVEANFADHADGFVCSNGRLCILDGEKLIDEALAAEEIARICATLDTFDAGYAFFGEYDLGYGGNPAYEPVAEGANGPALPLDELLAGGEPMYSYDIYFRDVAQRKEIEAALDGFCLVNPHGPHPSADVTVLGHGKGDAVRDLASALGVPMRETYAFGDGINDLSMIEAAGHGVAMGNAVPEVKAAAEYVTTDIDKDGVANGLAHYGLA
jgi:hydroxymethylpyrimidine pyrophosphatase-like HAD family hydrolase